MPGAVAATLYHEGQVWGKSKHRVAKWEESETLALDVSFTSGNELTQDFLLCEKIHFPFVGDNGYIYTSLGKSISHSIIHSTNT